MSESLKSGTISEAEVLGVVTDQEILCKKSVPADRDEISDIVQKLSVVIPNHAVGLAAPQIGIHKRIFLAILTRGSYAFINPKITWASPDKVPSEESCLSLPGIPCCVDRHAQVTISVEKLIDMKTGSIFPNVEPMRLSGRDSIIVQHENDHLDGILITHLPKSMPNEVRKLERDKKRNERIEKARLEKKNKAVPTPKLPKLSVKNIAKKKRASDKVKKKLRLERRQEKMRVEIQERFAADKNDLFSNDPPPSSEAINELKSD